MFSEAGYSTGSIGKLHFMPFGGGDNGWESLERWKRLGTEFNWNGPYGGFDHVELAIGHTNPVAHYGRWFTRNGGTPVMMVSGFDGSRPIPEELHDSVWVGERSARFISDHVNKPFFLFASFPDPHHPWDPPETLSRKYAQMTVPESISDSGDLKTRPAHYRSHFQGGWHRSGRIHRSCSRPERNILGKFRMPDGFYIMKIGDSGRIR